MREVPVYEAKARLSELLAEVEDGAQITITRRGVPVGRLVPVESDSDDIGHQRQTVRATLAALHDARITLPGDLKEIIAEGRR